MEQGSKTSLTPEGSRSGSKKRDDSKSVASKMSRNSISSSTRLKEAKIEEELAKRKRDQALEEQKLRRQQFELTEKIESLKINNEVENATTEAALWQKEADAEDGISDRDQIPSDIAEIIDVPTRTNEWCRRSDAHILDKEMKSNLLNNMTNQTQFVDMLSTSLNLPKPEIKRFSGNPIDYWGFMNNFDVNVSQKTHDESIKLSYLIQFCTGKAHDAIENCVLLDPSVGYKQARDMLYNQFGRNYVVAHAHINRVINRSLLRPGDSQGLWDLARDMRRCQITLTQMSYTADMSTTDNLLKVQELLPVHIQSQWANKAHSLMETQVIPNFHHMTDFMEQQAKAASNVFGMHVGRTQRASKSNAPQRRPKDSRASTFASQGDGTTIHCPLCSDDHHLDECDAFKRKRLADRFTFAKRRGLCFNCFRKSHTARQCDLEPKCLKDGCKRKHHTLLHSESRQAEGSDKSSGAGLEGAAQQNGAQEATVYTNQGTKTHNKVCLRVLPVNVRHGEHEITTWALLDDGSDVSLCDQSLAMELGIKSTMKTFKITTVNGTEVGRQGMEVRLTVAGLRGTESIEIPKVWTIANLPVSHRSVPQREDINQWPHLQGIELHTTKSADIRLLIGSDTPEAFWVQEERRGQRKEPYAIRTPLGWTLMGPTSKGDNVNMFTVHHVSVNDQLEAQVARFWELDHDIGDNKEGLGDSVEDKRALSTMKKTVKLVNGHYEIGLPWRYYPPALPNNRQCAEVRLQHLKRRLQKDKMLHAQYTSTVEGYVQKGYAKQVDKSKHPEVGSTWYLPHHPVTHPMKPDKVRVVFDCAARHHGVSLNDQLLQGPDYTNKLVGVLLRFRQESSARAADIEGMFHQVNVSQKDTEALRFLWWKDGDMDRKPEEYQMRVHIFGATSSPSCAGYALRKTVEENRQDFDEDVGQTVLDNFYVDDCLKSVPTVSEGKRLIPQLCDLLKRGGFRLTKWVSNNKDVLAIIPPSERAASVIDLDLDHLPIERTLGVWWNMDDDKFSFKVSPKDVPMTRRGLLSATSSLYDPLGFVAPFVLRAKILLQDLCAQGKGWDEPVGEEELQRWQNWVRELPLLTSVQINRCYKTPNFTNACYELHVFCDASERAYAAAAYIRVITEDGRIHCTFVMGKTRLCPLKKLTIPRLELSSAVLAVKLGHIVKEELRLPLQHVTYWSDSTSVLQYINNESRRFRTFVANRVAKIHELSDKCQWRHVDSPRNPADDGSRGVPADSLLRWLMGPEFLVANKDAWPVNPIGPNLDVIPSVEDLKDDPEAKKAQIYIVSSQSATN